MSPNKPTGPRSIAIVGPYLSGKTSLLESILFVTGTTGRKGSIGAGNTVGDSAAEARSRGMSTEVNVAGVTFLGDSLTFIDCPGSIELLQETLNVLPGVDAAVVVCEPEPEKALAMAPMLKALEAQGIPHMIFVNKIDKATVNVNDVVMGLKSASSLPLLVRHMPIVEDEAVAGYIDLAAARAYVYRDHEPSAIVEVPGDTEDEYESARYQMLETLADFDDSLMEKVLEDVAPERDEIYASMTDDFQQGLLVPVLLGAAEHENGVRRLLKALRHEVPEAARSAERAGAGDADGVLAQVLKTYHTPHGGKLSVARVFAGELKDGMTLNGQRVSGVFRMLGHEQEKLPAAGPGEVVGLGRLEETATGDTLSSGTAEPLPRAPVLKPVFAQAIQAARREDEVKMSSGLSKIGDEDPSVLVEHTEDTHELVLHGQGDIHLRLAMDRLANKYGVEVTASVPKVPYKEAIRKGIRQHGRHKKQSGGHGQFGDVHLEIQPLPRGSGFQFVDKIVGGAVPRQYIPAVEAGVKEYLACGPLGFPVVDVSVTLYDGQYHAVDSSEIAFKTAARIAMTEGMKQCSPVLLEPILRVEIVAPSEFTAKVNSIVSARRGQILGFDAREGWLGWDAVSAQMPQTEVGDLIIELRSATQGTGNYTAVFDHLQELTGRLADEVVEAHRQEEAA